MSKAYLKVSELHSIYYETCGNPCGVAAVFLHGGPGAGCTHRHTQFFDPAHYHIVLFDQRGCGKSTPRGSLMENTTWDLVDDLEKLRKHLKLERFAHREIEITASSSGGWFLVVHDLGWLMHKLIQMLFPLWCFEESVYFDSKSWIGFTSREPIFCPHFPGGTSCVYSSKMSELIFWHRFISD